jgi:hypothetical protein
MTWWLAILLPLLGDQQVVLVVNLLDLLQVLADQPELGHEFALNEPNQAFVVAGNDIIKVQLEFKYKIYFRRS